MCKIFESKKEPLFGRLDHKINLKPLKLPVLQEILIDYNNYSAENLLLLYTITGGIPRYLELLLERIKKISLENILKIDVGNYGLKAAVNLAIFRFLEGDFTTSKMHLLASSKIQNLLDSKSKNFRIYQEYLLKILSEHENKSLDSIDFITD